MLLLYKNSEILHRTTASLVQWDHEQPSHLSMLPLCRDDEAYECDQGQFYKKHLISSRKEPFKMLSMLFKFKIACAGLGILNPWKG